MGSMIARNISGAEKLFQTYAATDFWKNPSINKDKNNREINGFLSAFIFKTLHFCSKDSLWGFAQQKKISGDALIVGEDELIVNAEYIHTIRAFKTNMYQKAISEVGKESSAVYGPYLHNIFSQYKEFYDVIMNKQPEKTQTAKNAQQVLSNVSSKTSDQKNNSYVIPLVESKFPVSNSEINKVIAEAQGEYHILCNKALKNDFTDVISRILDNGIPLSAKGTKLSVIQNELAKDFETEKKIITDLEQISLTEYLNSTVDIQIKFIASQIRPLSDVELKSLRMSNDVDTVKATVDAAAKHGGNQQVDIIINGAEIKAGQVITVTFELPDTAEIARKYLPNGSPADRTISPSGNLKVYMKKINDVWYWNPFGW